MNRFSTKKIVVSGLMIALVFIVTYLPFLHIPSPVNQGYFNIGDSVIMIAAILLGRKSGLVVGALGSALADVALGSFIFAPVTFVVKGIEGYLVGLIAADTDGNSKGNIYRIVAVVMGALTMAAGYFVSEATILRLFDVNLGYAAAVAELPGNLVQGAASAVVGYIAVSVFVKAGIRKRLA
ncbi:MAG: ECF transporter S component [Clostridia bacterium]|nr:ECF transporter S component [Clostridia bacterium]